MSKMYSVRGSFVSCVNNSNIAGTLVFLLVVLFQVMTLHRVKQWRQCCCELSGRIEKGTGDRPIYTCDRIDMYDTKTVGQVGYTEPLVTF